LAAGDEVMASDEWAYLEYGEFLCRVFSGFDIFDMHHSWWFFSLDK